MTLRRSVRRRCTLGAPMALAVLTAAWLAALPTTAPVDARPAQDAVLEPLPRQITVDVGAAATMRIHVRDVAELHGADVLMAFDPTRIAVADADPGVAGVQIGVLSSFLAPDLVLRAEADNQVGTIWYAVTQMNPRQPVTGSGDLAEITLLGRAAGTANLTVTYHALVRTDGTTIQSTAENGLVTVTVGGRTATAAASRSPEATVTHSPSATLPPGPDPTNETPSPTPSSEPDPTDQTPSPAHTPESDPTSPVPIQTHSATAPGTMTATVSAVSTATSVAAASVYLPWCSRRGHSSSGSAHARPAPDGDRGPRPFAGRPHSVTLP